MSPSKHVLIIFIYAYLIHQAFIDFIFVSANLQGKIGYYNHNEASSQDKRPSEKFRKNLESLTKNVMHFFIADNNESRPGSDAQTSTDLPFMDYFHHRLIKRVIPKSEEACSSIQLMSFWKLYSDVINLVESEMLSYFDQDKKQGKIKIDDPHGRSSEVVTQSLEISKEISEEINNITKGYRNLTQKYVLQPNKTSKIFRNLLEAPSNQEKKSKQKRKPGRNGGNKTHGKKQKTLPTFDFGVNRYYYLE